jgi:hypothetical protein
MVRDTENKRPARSWKVVHPKYGEITVNELEKMIDFERYDIAGIRAKLYGKSLRATFFGKFYEEILKGYFEKEEHFKVHPYKPRVLLDHIRNSSILQREEYSFINNCKNHIKELVAKGRKIFIPDFLIEKEGRRFLVEAKVWPAWLGEKPQKRDNRLSHEVAQRYFIDYVWLLSEKCSIGGSTVDVHGKMIVWWERSEDHENIKNDYSVWLGQTFDLRYMREILMKLIKERPEWYIEIIKNVRSHVLEFLDMLENCP